jgi:hypothetical protein
LIDEYHYKYLPYPVVGCELLPKTAILFVWVKAFVSASQGIFGVAERRKVLPKDQV